MASSDKKKCKCPLLHNHWYLHRYTSALMVILGTWFAYTVAVWVHAGATLENLIHRLNCGACAVALGAFFAVLALQSYLAVSDMFTDYIHHKCAKSFAYLLLRIVTIGSLILAIAAIAKLKGII